METPSFKLVFICAFIALAVLGVSVAVALDLPSGRPLGLIFTQAHLESVFSTYSPDDKSAQLWILTRIDMAIPFAYGAFLYFASQRYATAPWVFLLVFWTMIGMIFDFTENATLFKILDGEDGFALKTIFTRAKFAFLTVPLLYCSASFAKELLTGKKPKKR